MTIEENKAFGITKWFNDTANETTLVLGAKLPQERGFALWPIGKIAVCRICAVTTSIISTTASVALFIFSNLIALGILIVSTLVGAISAKQLETFLPDFVLGVLISAIAYRILGLIPSGSGSEKQILKDNFVTTTNNVSEIFHGIKALFVGYKTSSTLNCKQLEMMSDGSKLNTYFTKVEPDYAFNNGKNFNWHQQIILLKGKENMGALYNALTFPDRSPSFDVKEELSDDAVIALRSFMYLGRKPLSYALAKELVIFADKYFYLELKNSCLSIIFEEINKKTVEEILSLAIEFNFTELQNACFKFVSTDVTCYDSIVKLKQVIPYTTFRDNTSSQPIKPLSYEIDTASADIQFTTKEGKILKAHRIIFQLNWGITFKKNIGEITAFSNFTEETVQDFLNIIYYKKLPNVECNKDSFNIDRIKNLYDLIESLKSDSLEAEFKNLRASYMVQALELISEKKLSKNETINRIKIIQEFGNQKGISSIVNQCVKLRVELDPKGDYTKDIFHLTELNLQNFDRYSECDDLLRKILPGSRDTRIERIIYGQFADEYIMKRSIALFEAYPLLKTVESSRSTLKCTRGFFG